MEPRDRRLVLGLFGAASIAWLAAASVLVTMDPRLDAGAGFLGAVVLGAAVATTSAPLLWLLGFARQRRIAYRGDWTRAARRGAWLGVLLAVYVVMRASGVFQPQIALFLATLALVAEVALSRQ